MKKRTIHVITLLLLLLVLLSGCFNKGSISERDSSAGLNGSFEKVKFGLPLNWNIYAPDGYKKTYDLVYDSIGPKEGKQSLKFEIHEVEKSEKFFRKPGFSGTINAEEGTYKISFWIKNKGCDFRVMAYGLGSRDNKPMVRTKDEILDWKYYEYFKTVPKQFSTIRFQVHFFTPGEFWIDDIRIEKQSR